MAEILSNRSNYEPPGDNWDWIESKNVAATNRTTKDLMGRLGYDNMRSLLSDIPRGGVILDVGSGKSPFFHDIATLRPDVTAINLDVNFPESLPDCAAQSPSNLLYLPGDMRQLPFENETLDWVFSNWALSYIVDPERVSVLKSFYNLAKPKGRISIGPIYDKDYTPVPERVYTFNKSDITDSDQWSNEWAVRIRDHPEHYFVPPL